jgi:predicted nucleic acid-binding protein
MLNQGEPQHQQAVTCVERLVAQQSLLIYNRLLEIELIEIAFKLAVRERHPAGSLREIRRDGRVRKRAGRLTQQLLESWSDVLRTGPSLVIELHEIADEVAKPMTEWGLASYDAVHAATAIYAGSRAILTLDTGFGDVPTRQLDVYIDRSRLAPCRKRRGGRSRTSG